MNKLTAKQASFVEYFCNPNSESFNNLVQSMTRANYSENYANHRSRCLLDNVVVIAGMKDYKSRIAGEQAITVEYIQSEHQRLATLAESEGDISVATRNKELLGKTVAAYIDKTQTEQLPQQKQLATKEQEEANRIANIRLQEKTA